MRDKDHNKETGVKRLRQIKQHTQSVCMPIVVQQLRGKSSFEVRLVVDMTI